MMIGNGNNLKSMAYVRNVVAFIKHRIETNDLGYHIFNYADKPDFSMNKLINLIEKKINIKLPSQSITYWFGMLGGYGFDFIAFITRKKFRISSVRVRKFCATTQFNSKKIHSTFISPYSLEEGMKKTLEYEFINPKKDNTVFYTE